MALTQPATRDYLKLLFWLKWKLMWRGYRRSMSAAFGVILALIVFLPISIGIGFACGLGFVSLEPQWRPHLLTAVLIGIYLFWVIVPMLGYALNESYDITKLFLFPLSTRQIFTGAILGSLLDFPILFVLPTLAAVLIGFTRSGAAFVFVAAAVALFLFHTLSLSQGLILASAGILRSRRFRDLMMVLIPLFWIGYYVVSQTLTRKSIEVDWNTFLNGGTWQAISYLPPGLASRAISAAAEGSYGISAVFLLGLALITIGTIYLCSWMIQKLFAGDEVGIAPRKQKANGAERTAAPKGNYGSNSKLPPVVQAVSDKEFKYLARDPYFRMCLMNLVYMLVVAIFMVVRPSGSDNLRSLGPAMVWLAGGLLLLSEMQMVCNIFGTEGGAASILFQFPASRRQILIGKNFTLFSSLTGVNLVFMLIVSGLAKAIEMFAPLFGCMTMALVVFMAVGNIASIRFPYRVVMKGWRVRQQTAGRGFGYGFLYLGFFFLAATLSLPVLAAFIVPAFFVDGIWYAASVPLAAAYAAGFYLLTLRSGERMLMNREIELVAKVSAEE